MTRGTLVRYGATWLLVVVATASLSWASIAQAGRETALLGDSRVVAGQPRADATGPAPSPPVPSPPARTPTHAPAPATKPPGPGPAVHRTHVTEGGTIRAACTGVVIELRSVLPAPGWEFDKESEEGELEITFEAAGRKIEVKVSCRSGIPEFSAS